MNMERISPQTEERRRKYFAEVAGKMTCLAVMAEIGKDEAIHGSGTQNDHEIAELCALLARKMIKPSSIRHQALKRISLEIVYPRDSQHFTKQT